HTNLGIAYEALKRWDKAIEAYKKAIQYSPATPPPYIRLGRLYNSLNRKDEALRVLKQVLGMVKEGPDAEEARRLLKEVEK
ncbi:MAG: tetratricopeptide repeat protein, partial [Deltaproteobacteria bacterium]|nr:tetratricopeptide repeat protein [Deltaproteobacteria bacterium]